MGFLDNGDCPDLSLALFETFLLTVFRSSKALIASLKLIPVPRMESPSSRSAVAVSESGGGPEIIEILLMSTKINFNS